MKGRNFKSQKDMRSKMFRHFRQDALGIRLPLPGSLHFQPGLTTAPKHFKMNSKSSSGVFVNGPFPQAFLFLFLRITSGFMADDENRSVHGNQPPCRGMRAPGGA